MIDGFTTATFDAVKAAFEHTFTRTDGKHDVGASLAVVHKGEVVIDLWGGHTDEAKTQEWRRDSIINVWSTTKNMTALCMLMLIDQGQLDPDAPVAAYWPEFAAEGKGNVLVRHIMSHTAGLPSWTVPIDVEVTYDWDRACALLAAQATWWEPGTESGYHAMTQGFLCGEVLRRITGRSLGTFFAQEVAGPLGADFHIGTSQAQDHRVIPVIPPASRTLDALFPDEPMFERSRRTLGNPYLPADMSFSIPWRRAEIPAGGGHGNARSVAVAQAAVSHGGVAFGRRLLSPGATDVIFREQCNGVDTVLMGPFRHGIGWGLQNERRPLPNERCCYWGGWGGSLCVNDLENGFTFAYVMNRMIDATVGDVRAADLLDAVYRCLGVK